MALVAQFTCMECREEKHEIVTPTRICSSCRAAIADAKELAHMRRLEALPSLERIRRLELQLYRLDAESRLKALETLNTRY